MKLKADSIDARLTLSGDMEITLRVSRESRAAAKGGIDELRDKTLSVEVKQWRERRSLEANAYAWVMIDKIAEAIKQGRTEVYRSYIREVPGNSQLVCVPTKAVSRLIQGWNHNGLGWITDTMPSKLPDCTNVQLYYGSSTYDTKQMSALIDLIVQDAKELGIETLTPMELERMKEEWREKQPSKSV
jgi:hypothetical protein